MKENLTPWYGVDFDGTLVTSPIPPFAPDNIGEPIWPMIDRVKNWLAEGHEVRIFTARASPSDLTAENIAEVEKWCEKYIGQKLIVTCMKTRKLIEIWDDRVVQVVENEGIPITEKI